MCFTWWMKPTTFLRKIAFALALTVASLVASDARATITEAQTWKSPAWNVPGIFQPVALHQFAGNAYRLRISMLQSSGWAPAPLSPPGSTPVVPVGQMTWVRVTGVGTTGLDYYGANPAEAELALTCQNTGMADVYGPMGNPQLMSANAVTCSIYTHPAGAASWTYRAWGNVAPGKMWYRPASSCGNSTGCWNVEIALTSGGTFTAWIQ